VRLIVKFECLQGHYIINIDNDSYIIDTNINGFENSEGNFDLNSFNELFRKTNIHLWESIYEVNGLAIEDSVKWSIDYTDDEGINFTSKGEEGYWPYEYDELIDALMIIDNKLDYFKANR